VKLSEATVADAVCPPGRKDALIFDDALPGFGLRVTAGGKRIVIFQYPNGAKVRRTAIGEWGKKFTVAMTRQVRDRRDPVAERKAERGAALAKEAAEREKAAKAGYTVDTMIG
jgi:hypothetical protein